MLSPTLNDRLQNLVISRLGEAKEVGLLAISLPLPPGRGHDGLALAGHDGTVIGLGQWPAADGGGARRALMIGDNSGAAPDTLSLTAPTAAVAEVPDASMVRFGLSPDPMFVWEQHALRLTWGNHDFELAMGLRHGGEIHWWEACRLVTVSRTATCLTVEMGGVIPVDAYGLEVIEAHPSYKLPYLHRHNWLNGHIHARLHSNGVCEIFAHHINSKFADDGLPFEDVVPVIGMRSSDPGHQPAATVWDGSCETITVGEVRLDVSEVASMASASQPGRLEQLDDWLVWQPYEGVELFSGICQRTRVGDPFIFHSADKHFPRGMARTIRFRLSLNRERSPRMARYLAPAWWYGACAEFSGEALLPVSNVFDESVNYFGRTFAGLAHRGSFEDGSLPRGQAKDDERAEPGWEGEVAYGLFLYAWRTGDPLVYEAAMRSAWYVSDVSIDHAAKQVRMHGYPPNGFALPMARVLNTVAAWLETGDPYLIDAARAVIETAHWTEKNSWPRLAVGRDACYVRGAVLLYRYLGGEHWLEIAREGIRHVAESQNDDGSFGDQGGGARVHQFSSYVIKPWMCFMAVGGLLDYLELFPETPEMVAVVRKLAAWLMRERFTRENGVTAWTYQHGYAGGTRYTHLYSGNVIELKTPDSMIWHSEYMARFFMYCTVQFRDPAYFDAWHESYAALNAEPRRGCTDHTVAQCLQFMPRLQAWLWRAELGEDGVHLAPVWLGETTPPKARICGPDGEIEAVWRGVDQVETSVPVARCRLNDLSRY